MKLNQLMFRPAFGSSAWVVVCGLMLTLGFAQPCLGQASKKGEKAADSLKALAKSVRTGEAQVTEATTALNQLCNRPNKDLRKPYKAFEKALAKLGKTTADAAARRAGLQQRREAFLKAWDEDLASIQNEDVLSRSLERREKVQQQLDALSKLTTEVSEAYQPFERQLRDIQQALGADLTPGGVQAVAPLANKAREAAVPVRDGLAKLSAELERLGFAMSSKAAKR